MQKLADTNFAEMTDEQAAGWLNLFQAGLDDEFGIEHPDTNDFWWAAARLVEDRRAHLPW